MGVCSYCHKWRSQDEECFGWPEARSYCGVTKPEPMPPSSSGIEDSEADQQASLAAQAALADATLARALSATPAQTKGDDLVRFAWLRLPGSVTLTPCVCEDGGWVQYPEAASRIQSLTASNEALERENESLMTKLGHAEYAMGTVAKFVQPRIPADQNPEQATSFLAWIGMILRLEERGDNALSALQAAQAEIARMREALEPFAAQSRRFDDASTDVVGELAPDYLTPHTRFTHAELRRARTALTPKEPT